MCEAGEFQAPVELPGFSPRVAFSGGVTLDRYLP